MLADPGIRSLALVCQVVWVRKNVVLNILWDGVGAALPTWQLRKVNSALGLSSLQLRRNLRLPTTPCRNPWTPSSSLRPVPRDAARRQRPAKVVKHLKVL
jgi:hypothetical protein